MAASATGDTGTNTAHHFFRLKLRIAPPGAAQHPHDPPPLAFARPSVGAPPGALAFASVLYSCISPTGVITHHRLTGRSLTIRSSGPWYAGSPFMERPRTRGADICRKHN